MKITTAVVCAAIGLLAATPLHAQEVDAATQADIPRNNDHVIIGVGALYAPAYEGSDTYRALPLPAIDVKKGRFFASLRDGVGVDVIDTDLVTIGASVTYTPGYRSKDVPAGVGSISFGAGGRGFVTLHNQGFVLTVGATQGFAGGTKGLTADASLSYRVPVTPKLSITPTIGTTWADAKFNDRYFGIDQAQSLASGLAPYRPGAGFKDLTGSLTATYRLTSHLALSASGTVTTVLGNDADAALVVHKTQPGGFLALAYHF